MNKTKAKGMGRNREPRYEPFQTNSSKLSPRQAKWIKYVLSCLWACVGITVLTTAVEQNALFPSYVSRTIVQAIVPQGWAFFTRDPRETWTRAYRVHDLDALVPANTADYRGGPWHSLGRKYRNRGVMLDQAKAQVPESAWYRCERSPEECLSEVQITSVTLRAHDNTGLCGRYLLQDQRTVPWAWRRSAQTMTLPSRLALVQIDCKPPEAI